MCVLSFSFSKHKTRWIACLDLVVWFFFVCFFCLFFFSFLCFCFSCLARNRSKKNGHGENPQNQKCRQKTMSCSDRAVLFTDSVPNFWSGP